MRVCLTARSLDPARSSPSDRLVLLEAGAWRDAGHAVCLLVDDLEDAQRPDGIDCRAIDRDLPDVALQAYPTHDVRRAMGLYQTARAWHAEQPFDAIITDLAGGEAYFMLRAKKTLARFDRCALVVRASPTDRARRAGNADDRLTFPQLHADLLEQEVLQLADAIYAETDALIRMLDEAREAPASQVRRRVLPLRASVEPVTDAERTNTVLFAAPFERRLGAFEMAAIASALVDAGAEAPIHLLGWETDTGPFGRSALDTMRRALAGRSVEITDEAPVELLDEAVQRAGILCCPGDAPEIHDAARVAAASGVPILCAPDSGTSDLIRAGAPGQIVEGGPAAWSAALLDLELARPDDTTHPTLVDAIGELIERVPPTAPATLQEIPVTVVVTVYNLGAYLRDAIESVANQTHPTVRTIIVDDGSTDPETIDVLAALEHEGWHVHRKPNGGLSSARNAGLALTETDWVLFFDADDVLAPDWITQAVGAVARDPGLSAVSPLVRYFETDAETPTGGWVPYGVDDSNRDLLPALNIAGAGAGSMLRADAIRAVGGYDEAWTTYEDWDLWCALADAGHRTTVVPEYGLRYRIRPDSMYRTEAVARHERLKSRLLDKHPGLLTTRTLRAQFGETARHQGQVAQAQAEAERLGESRRRLQARVERIEAQLREQSDRAARAIDAAEKLRAVERRLRAQHEQLESRLSQIESDRDQQRAAASEARERLASLGERLSASREALDKTRETLSASNAHRERLEASNEQLKSQVTSRGERFEQIRQQFEKQRETNTQLRARIDGLVSSHAAEVSQLTADLQAVRDELAETAAMRDTLAQSLHTTQLELAALPDIVVRELLAENARYRVADRVNGALKAVGVQRPLKAVGRLIKPESPDRDRSPLP